MLLDVSNSTSSFPYVIPNISRIHKTVISGYYWRDIFCKLKTYTYLRHQAGDTAFLIDTNLFLILQPSAKTESLINQPIYCLVLSTFLSRRFEYSPLDMEREWS